MQVVHYVMLVLTALVAVCPVVGQQVPRVAPVCAIIASIAGALLGVLAQVSEPAYGRKPATSAADAKPAGFARVGALAALAIVALVGCAIFRAAEPPIADCAKVVLDDAAAGLTLKDIELKDGARCGLDAARIIALLLESKDPHVTGSRAYGQVRTIGATLAAHPEVK